MDQWRKLKVSLIKKFHHWKTSINRKLHRSHLIASKGARVSETRHDIDRLSSLPDDVLCHILSFLPTKYSVRTRILSTRWKYLFSYVPILDFEYSSPICRISFLNFVDWVLNSHKSHHIIKFRFIYKGKLPQEYNFTSWISYVLYRGVREIDISFNGLDCKQIPLKIDYYKVYRFPCCLLSCKTLESLKLHGNFAYCIPESASLPCLKTLVIGMTVFDESTQRLLSCCHVLEYLLLFQCSTSGVVDISIPTLKKLRIDKSTCGTLLLNVPILECFDFLNSLVFGKIYGETFKSLEKASVSTNFICRPEIILLLLNMVCNARFLYLSIVVKEEFPISDDSLPLFNNLTQLGLSCTEPGLGLSLCLLEKSNNLRILVLTEEFIESGFVESLLYKCGVLPEIVPACVCLHPMEIEITQFQMPNNEHRDCSA